MLQFLFVTVTESYLYIIDSAGEAVTGCKVSFMST